MSADAFTGVLDVTEMPGDFRHRPPLEPRPWRTGLQVPEIPGGGPATTGGCVLFNGRREVLFLSASLRILLGLPDAKGTGTMVPEVLAPLLAAAEGKDNQPLRTWVTAALDSHGGEAAAPLHLTLNGNRRLRLELEQLQTELWLLSLEEYADLSARQNDVFEVLYKDGLTGAANRSLFEHKLDVALDNLAHGLDESVTVLLLDLDRFKAVNDTLGHAVGDALLGLVGERLRGSLRETDTLARLGGDEFAILLRNEVQPQRIVDLANRLMDLLKRPYLVDGHVLNIGLSLGVARAPDDGTTRDQLMRRADLALYHSKGSGRGVYHFFTPAMEERAQNRRALELDLRKALLLKQFELHYQPQIDVEHHRIIGLEALLRWRHPKRGLLLPSEFLPVAEEIGLAVPIGDWVLRTACKDAASWPEPVTVAVNVSPLQFESTEFARSAERALLAARLPGERLEIEVTEEILLLRETASVRPTLEGLRRLGVRVAMDGFGTGLASLSQLVDFSFDKIKIDRSLVSSSGMNLRHRAMLRAVSALGQSLGVATLAEGVETQEHLAQVRAEGCSAVQGFFYSKAVPHADLTGLFSELFREGLKTLQENQPPVEGP